MAEPNLIGFLTALNHAPPLIGAEFEFWFSGWPNVTFLAKNITIPGIENSTLSAHYGGFEIPVTVSAKMASTDLSFTIIGDKDGVAYRDWRDIVFMHGITNFTGKPMIGAKSFGNELYGNLNSYQGCSYILVKGYTNPDQPSKWIWKIHNFKPTKLGDISFSTDSGDFVTFDIEGKFSHISYITDTNWAEPPPTPDPPQPSPPPAVPTVTPMGGPVPANPEAPQNPPAVQDNPQPENPEPQPEGQPDKLEDVNEGTDNGVVGGANNEAPKAINEDFAIEESSSGEESASEYDEDDSQEGAKLNLINSVLHRTRSTIKNVATSAISNVTSVSGSSSLKLFGKDEKIIGNLTGQATALSEISYLMSETTGHVKSIVKGSFKLIEDAADDLIENIFKLKTNAPNKPSDQNHYSVKQPCIKQYIEDQIEKQLEIFNKKPDLLNELRMIFSHGFDSSINQNRNLIFNIINQFNDDSLPNWVLNGIAQDAYTKNLILKKSAWNNEHMIIPSPIITGIDSRVEAKLKDTVLNIEEVYKEKNEQVIDHSISLEEALNSMKSLILNKSSRGFNISNIEGESLILFLEKNPLADSLTLDLATALMENHPIYSNEKYIGNAYSIDDVEDPLVKMMILREAQLIQALQYQYNIKNGISTETVKNEIFDINSMTVTFSIPLISSRNDLIGCVVEQTAPLWYFLDDDVDCDNGSLLNTIFEIQAKLKEIESEDAKNNTYKQHKLSFGLDRTDSIDEACDYIFKFNTEHITVPRIIYGNKRGDLCLAIENKANLYDWLDENIVKEFNDFNNFTQTIMDFISYIVKVPTEAEGMIDLTDWEATYLKMSEMLFIGNQINENKSSRDIEVSAKQHSIQPEKNMVNTKTREEKAVIKKIASVPRRSRAYKRKSLF